MVFKNGGGRKELEKDKTLIVEGKPKGVLSFNIFEHLLIPGTSVSILKLSY